MASVLKEKTEQERLWKAVNDGDLGTVRTLLEKGTVDLHAGGDWVRSLSGPTRVGSVACGLYN
jgi:hypothetical protein